MRVSRHRGFTTSTGRGPAEAHACRRRRWHAGKVALLRNNKIIINAVPNSAPKTLFFAAAPAGARRGARLPPTTGKIIPPRYLLLQIPSLIIASLNIAAITLTNYR